MCGIAGIAGKKNQDTGRLVSIMIDSLHHRGPDARGLESFSDCCLGHARLSIVDLSSGQQPMTANGRNLCITFNGEIYGFHAIRSKLAEHFSFQTSSDTEVVLALYLTYGEKMLSHLPGMFAFALWDENRKRLFCARDRFGEKPFYYCLTNDGQLVFASELKAILASGLIVPEIDPSSVSHFFRHLYVHPHECIYKNIKVLPPGHSLKFDGHLIFVEPYWQLPEPRVAKISEKDAVEEFIRLFEKSVANQLVADVPVGVFLSGGLDSSSITAAASVSTKNLRTFSFGFGQNLDELPIAKSLSDRYATNHKVLMASDFKISDLLLKTAKIYDEPLADSSTIPTFLISEAASKECKVVLGGDGGDELLGGYNWYKILRYAQNAKDKSLGTYWLWKLIGKFLRFFNPAKGLEFSLKSQGLKLSRENQSGSQIIRQLNSYFSDAELTSLGLADSAVKLPDIGEDWVDASLRYDICNYLPGNILTKIDRAAMACSLELRAPFLDQEFAEFCISLPANLKIKKNESKYLLRKAYAETWPEEVRKHRKQGFGAPVEAWLKLPDVVELQRSILQNSNSRIYNYLPFAEVQKISTYGDYKSWTVLVYALWLENSYAMPEKIIS